MSQLRSDDHLAFIGRSASRCDFDVVYVELKDGAVHLQADDELTAANSKAPKNVLSMIALSHEHHDRANLSLGGKPQLGHWS